MMVKRIVVLMVFHLLWCGLALKAGNVVFRHLNMSDGLSHYSVMALYQDELGRIWMGTRNGLTVYDGDFMDVYKHSPWDSTSIHNNYIRGIVGDRNGAVYVHTNRGVCVFDMKMNRFKTLYVGVAEAIAYVDNILFMASGNRIFKYDKANGCFVPYYQLPDENVLITCFYMDGDKLMLGTEGKGVYLYNVKEKSLSQPLESGNISDIFKDSKGRLWIGTLENGIYLFADGKKLKNYRHQTNDKGSLCADYVREFCEDKLGNIWIGTFQGLNKYLEETDSFDAFYANSKTRLSHQSVWSLMCDTQGTLWVGTYFGGVNFINASQTVCQHYIVDGEMNGSLVVGAMVEDKHRNLWICTEGNGLCRFNLDSGETKWYRFREGKSNGISQNNLKSIYYDHEKNILWIGTHLGGLNKFDINTELFTHYKCNVNEGASSYKSNIVCDIVPYQNDLLLATHDGVYRFNPNNGVYTPMLKNRTQGDNIGLALDLHLDAQGILWIAGTDKGVYAYDILQDKLVSYEHSENNENGLSSNGVNYLYEDNDNRLWLCMAETGIELYRRETDDFEVYDEKHHGVLSNCVYGAYEVSKDKLLFITDNGFAYFGYATKKFNNFKTNTSLPLAGINQKSIYLASNGRIYIGGVDGLISFFPHDLERMTSSYQIFPSKLFVNDREIKVEDETGILKQALPNTPRITLEYEQNMFSIAYSVTNYVPLVHEEIVYKLENFSDTWTMLRNGRMITYTNLNPGKYTLLVKKISLDGHDGVLYKLEIEVLPPWYRTGIAYVCYFVLLVMLLYVMMHIYKNKVRLQTELEYERKHVQNVEALNQYKLRFFTNISHEFRTPLTIIIGQMELLLQIKSFVPAVYNRILNVYKSSMQLQSLITELLDFRKQEQGHMKIKTAPHDMVAFLRENYLLFHEYATIKGVSFNFESSDESVEVWYDSKQMQKVINNLLSNAFQYTPKGGTITLLLKKYDTEVVVSVADTGKGIKKDEIIYIFDRFYQTEATILSPAKGAGIGLALTKGIVELHRGTISVESEEGKGTVFTFRIPLGNAHLTADEMVEEDVCELVTMVDEEVQKDVDMMEEEEDSLLEYKVGERSSRILIVEDDEDLRQMLVDIFKPYYIVEQAADGKEGLDKVNELLPDIVLSDVLMPSMSGIELCKCIKSQMETCHIPVVLLTARTAVEHKLEGLQYGADDYIVKPFDVNILLARCRNLINGRIVLQEKFSRQPQTTAQIFATNPLDKGFMDKVMEVVENNMENTEFNVNLFAQEMAIARTKLFVKLKAITGQTPNDFILTVRMKKAAFLLKNRPELSISEISDMTGFSSPRYFSRVFKERYNMTPQSFRKEDGSQIEVECADDTE